MRQLKFLMIALLSGAVAFGFTSCSNNDNPSYGIWYANALVTVKPNADNSDFYMQLDENTTIKALNLKQSPFGTKEVRALANISYSETDAGEYDKAVYVNWIDSILTKNIAPDLGTENAETYGNDPVEIVNDWVTIAEDGYLTLRFRSRWDPYIGKSHLVNLVASSDPDNPYEITFHHNAFGDVNGIFGDGIVAFNLDRLPDTQGKTVDLTLKWNSFSGEKSTTFKYCTRKGGTGENTALAAGFEIKSERFADMLE